MKVRQQPEDSDQSKRIEELKQLPDNQQKEDRKETEKIKRKKQK